MKNKTFLLVIALASMFCAVQDLSGQILLGQYTPVLNLGNLVGDTVTAVSQTKYYYLVSGTNVAGNNQYASEFMSIVQLKRISGTVAGTMQLEVSCPTSITMTNANAFWAPVGSATNLVDGALTFYKMDHRTFSERRLRLKVVSTTGAQSFTIQVQGGYRRRTAF